MSERDARIAEIRNLLYPSDPTYCAEPIDIETARWLLDQLAAQDAEIAILRDPVKWMQWCDHRVLERCEAAEAEIAMLRKSLASLSQAHRQEVHPPSQCAFCGRERPNPLPPMDVTTGTIWVCDTCAAGLLRVGARTGDRSEP